MNAHVAMRMARTVQLGLSNNCQQVWMDIGDMANCIIIFMNVCMCTCVCECECECVCVCVRVHADSRLLLYADTS